MHRSIAGYNPYKLLILTLAYSKNFTTIESLTIRHMAMFVVESINIQINSHGNGSINWTNMQPEVCWLLRICYL